MSSVEVQGPAGRACWDFIPNGRWFDSELNPCVGHRDSCSVTRRAGCLGVRWGPAALGSCGQPKWQQNGAGWGGDGVRAVLCIPHQTHSQAWDPEQSHRSPLLGKKNCSALPLRSLHLYLKLWICHSRGRSGNTKIINNYGVRGTTLRGKSCSRFPNPFVLCATVSGNRSG